MGFYVDNYIISESQYYRILNEDYFYNNNIQKLEKLLGELRNDYILKQTKVHTDPRVKEASELIENIFGFNSFQLFIEPSKIPNAYTFALSSKVDKWNYKKCVIKTKDGIKFKKEAKVNIVAHITSKLFFDINKYTDREIIAVLLHEIGHNFSDSLNGSLGIFSNFKKVLLIPNIIVNPKAVSNIVTGKVTNMNDYMRKNAPELVVGYNAIKSFIGTLTFAIIDINKAISVLPNFAANNMIATFNSIVKGIVLNPASFFINFVFKTFTKKDEYMSDSFVTMYGYGPDLSSALMKMEGTDYFTIEPVIKSTEFGRWYYALAVESVDFVAGIIKSSHPSNGKRLLSVLNQLEIEYNRPDINPKTKKAVESDIKELKDLINKTIKDKSFEGNTWRMMYNRYVLSTNSTPKDNDIRELLDKLSNMEEQ